ncbi:MAG: hypothetical protein ACI97A_003501 [Planctomycetota bacterium]|jgi:hypothetical protein
MKLRIFFALFLAVPLAHGQIVQVEASFADNVGVIGQLLRFRAVVEAKVSMNGKEPAVTVPTMPAIDGLTHRFLGGGFTQSGQSISIIGGRRQGSLTFRGQYAWEFKASKVGRFRIPSLDFVVGGKKYRTSASDISIQKEAPGNRYVGTAVVVSSMTPYINQPVRLRYLLTTSRTPVQTRGSIPRLQIPWAGSPNGFKSLPLDQAKRREGSVAVQLNDGDQQVNLPAVVKRGQTPPTIEITLNKVLIPLAAGKINIGGTTASLEVARERREGGFFQGTQYVGRTRAVVTTDPIILEVRDAPTVGRPENYRGMMGDFSVDVQYGKGEIRAGDGVTLNIVLSGGEVLTLLEEPSVDADFPNCRVLPSGRLLEGEGEKRKLTFSWLIKPLSDTMTELPKFDFGWFRPNSGRFDVTSAGPLPLTIIGEMEEEGVFGGGTKSSDQIAVDTLGEGVRPLKDSPGTISPLAKPGLTKLLLVFFLPLVSLGALSLILKKRRISAGDATIGRRKRASKEAESRLVEAKALVGQKGFHGKLARSLAGFIADKIGVPPASVSAATVSSLLTPRGMREERIGSVTSLLNDLDMREFGGGATDTAEQNAAINSVEELVRLLDRELRS